MPANLTFDESAAEDILEAFDREVDEEGYIIDPETGEREVVPGSNQEIHIDDFSGVEKGSVLFLNDDFTTLVDHVKRQRED